MLDKQAANQGAKDTTKCPCSQNKGEILRSLPQRNHIGEDDLGHGDNAAAANALDRSADEEDGEVLGDRCAKDGAQSEEQHRDEEHLFTAKDV